MRLKSEIKSNVEKAISKGVPSDEIIEYISSEGYDYNDIADTSDMLSGYIMKGLQGLTLGHADEIGGGLLSLVSGKPYEQSRDQIRNAEKLFDAANPYSAMGAEVAGGLTSGLLTLSPANTIPSLAKSGALLGAGAGHGYSEGETLKEKAIDSGTGLITGGLLGGLTKPVADTVKGGVKAIAAPVLNTISKSNPSKVYRDVVRDIEADGLTVDDVMTRLDKLGDDAIIPDAAGGNTLSLAKHVAETPGEGVDAAQKFLSGRDLGQGSRLSRGASRITGRSDNFYDELDGLLAKRQENASPLYDEFVNDISNQVDMGDFAEMLKDNPFLLQQVEKVSSDPLWNAQGIPVNSIKFINTVKKSLDDMYSNKASFSNQEKNAASMIEKSRKQLVSLADEKVPGYADARKAFEIPSKQMEMMTEGRKFMKGDSEIIAKQVDKMSPEDKEYFLSGVIRQIDDTMKSAPDNADMTKRIFGSEKKREAIKAAFGDSDKFKTFEDLVNAEQVMNKTKQKVLVGSPTYSNQAKADQAKGVLTDAAMDLAQNNPLGAVRNTVKGVIGDVNQGYSPDELAQLSRLFFTPKKEMVNTRLFDDLRKKQGLLTLGQQGNQLMNSGLLGFQNTQLTPSATGLLY